MAITIQGTKSIPVDADMLIIRDSEEADPNLNLKEIAFSDIGIASIELTDTDNDKKTYTMYSDVAEQNALGTFEVVDGADGAGNVLPTYSSVTTYGQGELVKSNDSIYRSFNSNNLDHEPSIDGVDTADWEIVTARAPHYTYVGTPLFTVQNNQEVYADSSTTAVTITVPEDINRFVLHDWANTWNNGFPVTVVLGADSILFTQQARGVSYTFVRFGTTWRAYGTNSDVIIGNI